ncbi:MAG: MarR family winged helix-turn-helix transcriptional regulator [Sulfuricaulis sp.]
MFERCLYFNVNALARRINQIWEEAFADLRLSPAHAYLLRLVLSHPGISQKDIASELRLEKSTVTRFIDTLEARGYLKRRKVNREQSISPASAAAKLEKELERRGDALYRRMLDEVGKTAVTGLVRQLRETGQKLK